MFKPFNITEQNLPYLVVKLKDLLEKQPEKNWQILIKQRNSDRSLEQNARLWELYTSIADYTGYESPQMIHELMGYKFLLEEKVVQGEHITKIKSTTKLSVKEMQDYMTKIEAWASEKLGWSF